MNSIRIENFIYPYVRFLNASFSIEGADFYVGNSLASPRLGFGCFSGYVKVPAGNVEIRVKSAADKEKIIDTVTLPFKPGSVYTVAVVNADGSPMLYGISEPTQRDNVNCNHLRVCHLTPFLKNLDVNANGYKILGDIDYLEISKYMCLLPGKYEFSVFDTKSGSSKLVMPNQNLEKGKYNTLYVVGNDLEKTPLMGLLSVDAASYTGYYL